MPKSGVDGPSYAGHVNVNPYGDEPEWVLDERLPHSAREETQGILGSPKLAEAIEQGRTEIARGEGVSSDELDESLGRRASRRATKRTYRP